MSEQVEQSAENDSVVRTTDDVPSSDPLAALLWLHRLFGDADEPADKCGCGAVPPEGAREEPFGEECWHDEHVADAIREHMARTWDLGWCAGSAAALRSSRPVRGSRMTSASATSCDWCGLSNDTHANGCRLGLGPDERGAHRTDCNCAPPYADCRHPPCDCTECVYDCSGPCGYGLTEADKADLLKVARPPRRPVGPYSDQAVRSVTAEHYFVVSPTAYGQESCACGWYRDGWDAPSFEVHLAFRLGLPLPEPECPSLCGDHHWLDRPESDTHECLICGVEGSGPAPADVVIRPEQVDPS